MNSRAIIAMIYIYNPSGIDWMNICITKNNKYSYHHIVEEKRGGEATIENGAILSETSHRFLHILQQYIPRAYNDLQKVFKKINLSMQPPSNELIKEIDQILHNVFYTSVYNVSEYDLPVKAWRRFIETRALYESGRHVLSKCLK